MTSYSSRLRVKLFSRDSQDFGGYIFLDINSSDEYVYNLKTKVKDTIGSELSSVSASRMTVWRCKDRRMLFDVESLETLPGQIKELLSGDELERLHATQTLADLHISMEEILLVEVPSASPGPQFEPFYLQADTRGKITIEDIELNDIQDAFDYDVPIFVKEQEKMLSLKRKVSNEMYAAAKFWVGEAASKEYFDTADSLENPQPISTISQTERSHLSLVSTIDGEELWARMRNGSLRDFNIDDAYWLFFFQFSDHLMSTLSNVAVRCNFLVLKSGLPRMAVMVNSNPYNTPAVDQFASLMLQAASIVRFANTHLEAFKEKDFIFTAIYITDSGYALRYILYQTKRSDTVYRKCEGFKFTEQHDRIKFMLELYNLSVKFQKESGHEDTRTKVKELTDGVRRLSLPSFTYSNSPLPSNDGGSQPRQTGGDTTGADAQLRLGGYKVVPDVLDTDGSIYELINKLPPHLRTVYRWSDPNKTELIAKYVRKRSNELNIFEYLQTKQPQSPHVISLIEAVPAINGEWLILPILKRIRGARLRSATASGRVHLGWGLIKGLAYLHEHRIAHRDIKPDNLVCDDDFRLQIIDFDAPEMGTQDEPMPMYSPIKADRWSCGRVLLRHILVGKGDDRIWEFAKQLVANDPQQRPSLLEWHNFQVPAAPFSHVFQRRQDMVGSYGETCRQM
ncbi:hypothetical protein EI94DRAFT_1786158 [Lactarius quietus]|nr:hypothetical protein EI94DRAFT_1786158 [Lactarius quietus]